MAIKFINPAEAVQQQGIKALVFGPAGSGKTMLCATAGEPTLIISAEAGLLSIRNAPKHVSVIEVHTRADVEEIFKFLQKEGAPPWVCLDSVSEVAAVTVAEEKLKVKDKRQAYGEMQEIMERLIKGFRDLPNTNVLFTATQAKIKDGLTGNILFEPGMPGQKLGAALPYYFDLVLAARVFKDTDGNLEYTLQTGRDEQYEAKDRSGVLELYETPDLAALSKKIQSAQTPTQKAA